MARFPLLDHLEIHNKNLNLYPHLITHGIKVSYLKITVPIAQLVPHMLKYLNFTCDKLKELEIFKTIPDNLLNEFRYNQYFNLSSLKKLRFKNFYESCLRDYFRPSNRMFLYQFSF